MMCSTCGGWGAGRGKQGSGGNPLSSCPAPWFLYSKHQPSPPPRTHQLWGEQLNRNRVSSSLLLFTPRF